MPLTKLLIAVPAIVLGVGAIVVATQLQRQEDPAPQMPAGSALELGAHWEVKGPLSVGQEVVDMFASIKNSSSNAVELKSIKALPGSGIPGNGEVVDVFLVESPFQATLYNTLPPVMRSRGRCVTATVSPVDGYVLRPHAEVMVAMHIRASRLGTFRTEGRDIFYVQAGQTYRQREPYFFVGKVRSNWERKLLPEERRCRAHAVVLPSGV